MHHGCYFSCLQRTFEFRGGEAEALKRLRHYLWDSDAVADYFNTRNGVEWLCVHAQQRHAFSCQGRSIQALRRDIKRQFQLAERDVYSCAGMTAGDDSTKFSPWLAAGCLSPRLVYHELKKYEGQRTANKSTYWVRFKFNQMLDVLPLALLGWSLSLQQREYDATPQRTWLLPQHRPETRCLLLCNYIVLIVRCAYVQIELRLCPFRCNSS